MAKRPSEPILGWLRNALESKGLNSAALAKRVSEKRSVVRNVLAGQESLTVDQLMTWTQALELSLEELMGIPESELPSAPERSEVPDDQPIALDPYGIQAEQACRLAFGLGVDFALVADSSQLQDSGIPASVLERFPEQLVLKLDAAYHRHNHPRFDAHGITLTLSFDALRTCTVPWAAVLQVVLDLVPPPPSEPERAEEGADRPMLRLVT